MCTADPADIWWCPPARRSPLADGKLEWKLRSDSQVEMVALGELAARAAALLGR